jgi:hypothetical protein
MSADTTVTKAHPLAWLHPCYVPANLFDDTGGIVTEHTGATVVKVRADAAKVGIRRVQRSDLEAHQDIASCGRPAHIDAARLQCLGASRGIHYHGFHFVGHFISGAGRKQAFRHAASGIVRSYGRK